MDPIQTYNNLVNRRFFLGKGASAVGVGALSSLIPQNLFGEQASLGTHFPPKAKRVIYLFMSGGPSHLDLWDYKPGLSKHRNVDLPASVRMGQRITGMTSGQARLPVAPSLFNFRQQGNCGTWTSELMPYIGKCVDDIALIKSIHTESINHDPATTHIQTGSEQPGRPALGAWVSYGLGSDTQNLPAFIVMISQGSGNKTDQPIFARLWGSGFLPSVHQGVRFRTGKGDAVLYLSNPNGIDESTRRAMLDSVEELNRLALEQIHDPEIATRIAQYELAFRMQTAVPELQEIQSETRQTLNAYGIKDNPTDGGFAKNCLLARRMMERGVRFVQLMHRGWDQHSDLPRQIRGQSEDVDKPVGALLNDLKQRGLLEDTLVLWGGEFGRTVYSQGTLAPNNYGRDHHGRCFSMWMAGGGAKGGTVYGETDDFGYNITKNPVHLHDWNATILHLMGINHKRLTFRQQGRDFRLTDIAGEVVKPILA
ncbi:MAG: DUF1501 domain-containing protein [Gemmataceae bacterium]|nr:DUF1501 domain-containing protein [Gemmataceae bacterium]